jgi:hypothetical protein
MRRGALGRCGTFWSLVGSFALVAGPALASFEQLEETLRIFRELPAKGSGIELKVWINQGNQAGVRIGDEFRYHFSVSKDAYLTAVHVDPHGVATVLYSGESSGDNKISAGIEKFFPPAEAGYSVEVSPPLGKEDLFAIATPAPIPEGALGIDAAGDAGLSLIEAADAAGFARRLHDLLSQRPANTIAFAHVEQRVSGRGETQYAEADTIAFFTTRTRAIRRTKLDLPINFATESSGPDEAARLNLEVIGLALVDPKLASKHFAVG